MAVLTSQKIKELYTRYRDIDVTFSKEIIAVSGLDPKQVYIKCVSDFFPCLIFSSSFGGAKVLLNIKSGIIEKLQQANNALSLRFCFKHYETGQQVIFFVQARSLGHAPYNDSPDTAIFNLQYPQQPPDDYIEILGRILNATVNSTRRREERVIITPEVMRKLKLLTKDAVVFVDGVPRRCILRDLSFSGARIVMLGVAKFLEDRAVGLRVDFDDPQESFNIKGTFKHVETVEGRKDLVVLGIEFQAVIPMGYKLRLSDYLDTVKVFPANMNAPKPLVVHAGWDDPVNSAPI
ncbi:MAG: PilZ domain-containing protein [Spirochaetaceae bacterium]|jgi:hypothetical protein|nr:PilZ domain-containing protein [Spirochaetaceae bacterium]